MIEQYFSNIQSQTLCNPVFLLSLSLSLKVSVYDLVVGDIVELGTGDEVYSNPPPYNKMCIYFPFRSSLQIPADGLVYNAHSMKVDESTMTGESDSIKKGDVSFKTDTVILIVH